MFVGFLKAIDKCFPHLQNGIGYPEMVYYLVSGINVENDQVRDKHNMHNSLNTQNIHHRNLQVLVKVW